MNIKENNFVSAVVCLHKRDTNVENFLEMINKIFYTNFKKLALNYLGNGVYYIFGSDAHSDERRNTHISEDCLEILGNYKDEFIKNGSDIN